MPALFLVIFRFFRLLMTGHPAVALENAALRLPLAAFQRKRKRPVLTALDRVFWVTLRRWWSGWRGPLFSVQADTVTHWQRERFRRVWARWCHPHGRRRGRPATAWPIRPLIQRMLVANPLWRAPRLHGKRKMLGARFPSERDLAFCDGYPGHPVRPHCRIAIWRQMHFWRTTVRRIDCGSRLPGTNRPLSRIHSPARVRARYNGASRAGGNLLAAGGFV